MVPSELLLFPSHPSSMSPFPVLVWPRLSWRGAACASMPFSMFAEGLFPLLADETHKAKGRVFIALFGRVSSCAAIPQEKGCCSDCILFPLRLSTPRPLDWASPTSSLCGRTISFSCSTAMRWV